MCDFFMNNIHKNLFFEMDKSIQINYIVNTSFLCKNLLINSIIVLLFLM